MADVLNPETESTTLNTELEMPTLDPATEQEQPLHESTSNPETAEVNLPALDADATNEPVAAAPAEAAPKAAAEVQAPAELEAPAELAAPAEVQAAAELQAPEELEAPAEV